MNGHILAFQKQYHEAAELFVKARQAQIAVDMFTDLRRWDDARYYAEIVESGYTKGAAAVLANKPHSPDDPVQALTGKDDPLNMTMMSQGGQDDVTSQQAKTRTNSRGEDAGAGAIGNLGGILV